MAQGGGESRANSIKEGDRIALAKRMLYKEQAEANMIEASLARPLCLHRESPSHERSTEWEEGGRREHLSPTLKDDCSRPGLDILSPFPFLGGLCYASAYACTYVSAYAFFAVEIAYKLFYLCSILYFNIFVMLQQSLFFK